MRIPVLLVALAVGMYIAYRINLSKAIDEALDEALLSADDREWIAEATRGL